MMAAACFPAAQNKVQGQLDAVVGQGRGAYGRDYVLFNMTHAINVSSYIRGRSVSPIHYCIHLGMLSMVDLAFLRFSTCSR